VVRVRRRDGTKTRRFSRLPGFAVAPWTTIEVSAQSSGSAPVIGLLDAGERSEWWAAFRQQRRDLGYVEGRNPG
jgi:hypothetical protein